MPTSISASDRTAYQRQLKQLASRLSGGVAQLEAEAIGVAPDQAMALPVAHEADPAVREAEEEVARSLLISEEHLLSEVTAALDRIANGQFGQCEQCGRGISKTRLNAMPYARNCIRCARQSELTESNS